MRIVGFFGFLFMKLMKEKEYACSQTRLHPCGVGAQFADIGNVCNVSEPSKMAMLNIILVCEVKINVRQ